MYHDLSIVTYAFILKFYHLSFMNENVNTYSNL